MAEPDKKTTAVDTLFGSFEMQDVEGVETPPADTPPADTPPATPPAEEPPAVPPEDTPPGDTPPADATPPVAEPVVESEFDSIVDSLESEGMLFLDPEKRYENTKEGFAEMMRDNLAGQKAAYEKAQKEAQAEQEVEFEEVFTQLDPEKAEDAEVLVREHLRLTGHTPDEIDTKVAAAVASETLDADAKIAHRVLSDAEGKAKTNAAAAKVAADEAAATKREAAVTEIKEAIDSMEEIAGFKLDEKTGSAFKDYLFKKGADGKTPAQRVVTDSERRIRLAFYDFIDFNKGDFELQAKTAVSNEFKKKRSRFTDTNVAATTGKPKGQKPEPEIEDGVIDMDLLRSWGGAK